MNKLLKSSIVAIAFAGIAVIGCTRNVSHNAPAAVTPAPEPKVSTKNYELGNMAISVGVESEEGKVVCWAFINEMGVAGATADLEPEIGLAPDDSVECDGAKLVKNARGGYEVPAAKNAAGKFVFNIKIKGQSLTQEIALPETKIENVVVTPLKADFKDDSKIEVQWAGSLVEADKTADFLKSAMVTGGEIGDSYLNDAFAYGTSDESNQHFEITPQNIMISKSTTVPTTVWAKHVTVSAMVTVTKSLPDPFLGIIMASNVKKFKLR